MFLSLAGLAVPCGSGHAEIRITCVVADGQEHPVSASSGVFSEKPASACRLSSPARNLTFRFAGTPGSAPRPIRLKYKMEGVDAAWTDLPSQMVVLLRLIDGKGQTLAGDQLALAGDTPGWNGRPGAAPLEERAMSLTAPCLANRVWAYFISNGGSETVGQMVVDDVRVRVDRHGQAAPEYLALDIRTGERMDHPLGRPEHWKREGARPDIAQVIRRDGADGYPVLFLNDDDPDKFGVWRSLDINTPIRPGDTVTLLWKTAYTIGRGGSGSAAYAGLRPGAYWFRVAAFLPDGHPTGQEAVLPVTVLPPFYRRAEFWLAAVVGGCALVLLAVRFAVWRRMKRRLATSERRRLLEAERMRIARDIHDDLGASLAQIAMLSEMAEDDVRQDRPAAAALRDIFTRAHDTTRKLDEIVWAIKPANDTLEHLVGYLCQFAETHFKLAGVRFRFDAPETLPPFALTSDQRHNFFLAAKEAIHNTVKHACATEVRLRVCVEGRVLALRIEDDGSGVTAGLADDAAGRGSANMRARMEQLGGTCVRTGHPGKGTVVELTLPIKEPIA